MINHNRENELPEYNGSQTEIEAFVIEAQQGNTDAFEALFQLTHKRLLMFCWRMMGNSSAAEEMVQESFIKAWLALSSFRGESQFYTWLRQIASRLIIDKLRLKSEKVWQNQAELDGEIIGKANISSELIDLSKMIKLLPPAARSVLVLHDIEGYSHKEIASLMSIAEGTSKAQLSRARSLLKAALV